MARERRTGGSLAARERRLALVMLAPAFIIVFLVVLFPVLANFWISLKEVRLGDLRAPTAVLRERIVEQPEEPGESLVLRYLVRNSSPRGPITGVSIDARLPAGLEPLSVPDSCEVEEAALRCDLGRWEGGHIGSLEFEFRAAEEFFAGDFDARSPTAAQVSGRPIGVLGSFDFTLENFRHVLSGSEFWPTFWVTIIYTVGGSVFSILLGLFAAQLLNASFPGQGFLRGLFLFPYIAPVIAVAFTWAFFLDPFSGSLNLLGVEYGLFERPISFLSQRSIELSLFGLALEMPLALSTVIAFEAWRYFPFAFLFILARFQAMPKDTYEAAEVDGASPFQQFRWVTLPQLVGVLSTLFLLRFIWTFNKFDDIFLLTGGAAGTETLTIRVYDYAFAQANIGAGAATAVILFVILAIFMVLYFKFVPEEA